MTLDKLQSILLILTLLSARDHCHDIKILAIYSGYLSINLVRWNKIEKFDKN